MSLVFTCSKIDFPCNFNIFYRDVEMEKWFCEVFTIDYINVAECFLNECLIVSFIVTHLMFDGTLHV